MKPTYVQNLNYLVKCLHYRHGVGDILEIRRYADGVVEVEAKGTNMRPHVRRGRVEAKDKPGLYTVKMYGHQITGCVVGEYEQ